MRAKERRRAGFLCGVAALLAALLAGSPAPGAAADAEDPYRLVGLALGQGLLTLFPATTGYVVSARGDEIYIDLAEKDLLRPGMEFQVYRPGEAMVHPVTKQSLGTYEENLGTLRIDEVREKYSRGTLGAGHGAILPGDRVRVSSRRLRALLHFSGEAPGVALGPLASTLIARGEESGRFQMVDEPSWSAALGQPLESAVADPAALRRLGEKAPADLLLTVRLGQAEGRASVAVAVHSLRTGVLVGELREPWPSPGTPPAAPAAGAPRAPTEAAESRSPAAAEYTVRELSTAARCLAVGDITGEGKAEILLSDGRGLALYRWEPAALAWKWSEDGPVDRKVLSLDAGDFDGDGRTEVLVSTAQRGRVRTEVRAWRGGRLEVAGAVVGLYLRAARRDGGGASLLGQRAGNGEALAGPVEDYRWKDGAAERIEGTARPRQAGIFGLAPLAGALFSMDRNGFIRSLAPDGRPLWRSGRSYGGYPVPAGAGDLYGMGIFEESAFEEEMRAFQGRLLGEAGAEGFRLFVPRNFSGVGVTLTRHRELGQGEIVVLAGTRTNLEEIRSSRPFDGYVADEARWDLDGDGRVELLFVVNRSAGLLGERGRLVVWKIPGS